MFHQDIKQEIYILFAPFVTRQNKLLDCVHIVLIFLCILEFPCMSASTLLLINPFLRIITIISVWFFQKQNKFFNNISACLPTKQHRNGDSDYRILNVKNIQRMTFVGKEC